MVCTPSGCNCSSAGGSVCFIIWYVMQEYIYGDNAGIVKEGYDLGGLLRVGVEVKLSHFRIGLDYNHIKTESTVLHDVKMFFGWHY